MRIALRKYPANDVALALAAAMLPAVAYMSQWTAPVIFVALVPFAAMQERSHWRRGLWLSYLAGLVFFQIGVMWLAWVTVIGSLLLSAYLAAYFVPAACQVRLLRRWMRLPMAIALPIAWTTAEFIRARLFGGFPWLLMGHSLHNRLAFIQIADTLGVYGISFAIAAINGLVFDSWHLWRRSAFETGRRRLPVRQTVCAAAIFALILGYGLFRLWQTKPRPGPVIAIVQANIEQDAKNDPSIEARRESFGKHMDLSNLAAAAAKAAGTPADLIVWPETMITGVLSDTDDEWSGEMRRMLTELAARHRCRLLVGANHVATGSDCPAGVCPLGRDSGGLYNSAFYIDRFHGADSPIDRYDKMHLVPFGEYVPFGSRLPFLMPIVPYERGFTAGTEPVVFELKGTRFGVLICFEDVFPELAAQYFRDGREVDFFIVLSNDGWFGNSPEIEQHMAISRFRAVEYRRSVVRATNTGISGFIGPDGRLQSILERNGRRKQVAGWLVGRVMLDDRATFYMKWGNVFAWANLAAGALLAAVALRRRIASRTRLSEGQGREH